MIISTESKDLYQQFKFINLNDESTKLDTSIVNMINNDFDENQKLYIEVTGFLIYHQEQILKKIDNKNNYKEIFEKFKILSSAIDLVHLNQIVNDFGQEKLLNCVIN
jgi:hypothetical protein